MKKVVVVGCGVIGITSGLILLRAGHNVTIISKNFPPNVTSNMAGAFWYPVLDESFSSQRNQLSFATYKYVHENIMHCEEAACVERMIDTYYNLELAAPHEDADKHFPSFKVIPEKDIPAQINCLGGFSFNSFIVDTDVYLNFLLDQFKNEGGQLVVKDIVNLDDLKLVAFGGDVKYDAVVNCSGLGSQELFGDETMFPVRGQTILVEPISGYNRMTYIDSDDPTYILPRKTDCVLGGTYQFDDSNISPDPQDTSNILQKVSLFGVKDLVVKRVKVGLRPGRPCLRLEKDILSQNLLSIPLIHNYGHGGRGFTLSWGCALQVLDILNESWTK